MTLTEKLKELRTAHGYKQVDIASVLGITRQSYSLFELGKRTPKPNVLYKIAAYYDISVEELFRYTIVLDPELYYTEKEEKKKDDDLSSFLEYLEQPMNKKRLKFHSQKEKELLYYFASADPADQALILELVKMISQRS